MDSYFTICVRSADSALETCSRLKFRRSGTSDSERYDAMQQVRIFEPVVTSRLGKLFDARDLGIGVGLDVIRHTVCGETEIDASIAIELQRPVDALGGALDFGAQIGRAHV